MNNHPICIIDDDEDVRAVMGYALEFEGLPSIHFGSALRAIDYLKNQTSDEYPSLIIVDFTMPEMNGLEFIMYLKNVYPETLGKIPLALSTARIPDADEVVPEDVIMLPKPVDLPELISVAREHFHSSNRSSLSF